MPVRSRHFGRRPVILGRSSAIRDPRPRVLIVCEGECTEPYYFEGLRRDLGLGNVQVMGRECGSAPINVVEHALKCYQSDPTIDQIFCVVDRDEHESFDAACAKVAVAKRDKIPIEIIRSYPSFEYWYLLHFKFSRAPLVRSGRRSPGDNAVRALKAEFPAYKKVMREIWTVLSRQVPQAITHAKQATNQARQDGSENPSTEVHKLVSALFRLSTKK